MKTRGRPFAKGQSGNPGGCPKELRDIIELARSHGPEAIKTLADVMNNDQSPPAARVAASTAILDRGYGKPPQTIDANLNVLDKLSDDEQRALLAALSALDGESGDPEGGPDCTINQVGAAQQDYPEEGPLSRDKYAKHMEFFAAGLTHQERCGGSARGDAGAGRELQRCHPADRVRERLTDDPVIATALPC